jgi:hypothetical protein
LIIKDLQKGGPQKNQEIFFGIFQALGMTSAPPSNLRAKSDSSDDWHETCFQKNLYGSIDQEPGFLIGYCHNEGRNEHKQLSVSYYHFLRNPNRSLVSRFSF